MCAGPFTPRFMGVILQICNGDSQNAESLNQGNPSRNNFKLALFPGHPYSGSEYDSVVICDASFALSRIENNAGQWEARWRI